MLPSSCEFLFFWLNSQRDLGNVLFTSREQCWELGFRHLRGVQVTVRGYLKFDSFVNKPAKSFYSFPTICNPPTAPNQKTGVYDALVIWDQSVVVRGHDSGDCALPCRWGL